MKPAPENSIVDMPEAEFATAADAGSLAAEILAGLRREPRQIAPKYFYDQKGAALFDQITELDEYYLTRTEAQIFRANRQAICDAIGTGANIVEPGAGSCEKIRWLLPELEPSSYTPMDISAEHLHTSAAGLSAEYPELNVTIQVCDHTAGLLLPDNLPDEPLVFFYPGSSIGNFEPAAAANFMQEMHGVIGDEGGLLIGVDAKKDKEVLHAAYNDRAGITAQFNLNVLDHINSLLEGNLSADNFEHVAIYNERLGRIEMYLRCKRTHTAQLANESLSFNESESIHTENSYKYSPDEFVALAQQAGFAHKALWQDERAWFSLLYFVPN